MDQIKAGYFKNLLTHVKETYLTDINITFYTKSSTYDFLNRVK